MGNLIHFELRKLFRAKSFYILGIISLTMIVLRFIMMTAMGDSSELQSTTDFICESISNSILMTLSPIFIALFVCEDDSSGFIKNIYAKGYSRTQVFFGKYLAGAAAMCVYLVVAFLCSTILGFAGLSGVETTYTDLAQGVIGQVVAFIGAYSIFFAVSILIGRAGFAMAINIVGLSLVSLVLALVDSLLANITTIKLSLYWINDFINELSVSSVDTSRFITILVASVAYIAVSVIVGLVLYRRKEV